MPRKLVLVDGSNHAFRVFHAMPRLTADGRHTGALLGFANLLRYLEREESPDFLAVVFDRGKSFRVDLYPEYKGHRPSMPEELREQWPEFQNLVEAWGYRFLAREGVEADDVIATLAERYKSDDLEVVIVSGDKDFLQLVDGRTRILDLKKDKGSKIGVEEVKERFGVGPEHVVDILSLWGDSSDNVPGVPGIGEKKGADLVRRYGGLEDVLAHAQEVKGKMGENLREYAEQARLAHRLVTLCRDLDLPETLDDLRHQGKDFPRLQEFFVQFQLRTHLKDLQAEEGAVSSAVERDRYRTVLSSEDLQGALAACRAAGRFAVDLETTSLDPLQAQIVGIALCWSEDDAVYVPVGHDSPEQLSREQVLASVFPLLADPTLRKTGQNLKYDLEVLLANGAALCGIHGDTLLADYLLEPARERRTLDDLALRYLGHKMISYEEATQGLEGGLFAGVSLELATRYAAEDAHVAWLLDRLMEEKLQDAQVERLYREVELPVIPVLAAMELAGISLDMQALAAVGVELEGRIQRQQEDVYEMVGREFNMNSTQQLAVILFDERGLKPVKRTKTGRSTDAATLEQLAAFDPLPAAILEYRSMAKLKNTYVDALPQFVSPVDGRVHTSFHQAVAATGRLSSNEPNLQNIPIRTTEGRQIRSCFVPDEGHVFISADYSQIELRVLADYCGDGPLVDAFLSGEDIHRRTAAEVFAVMPALVTNEQRRAAKAINFGIIYGMSAFRLSRELQIPNREAQRIIDNYFLRYPQVRRYVDGAIASARESGMAITRMGRRRVIPDLGANLRHVREAAERVAVNTPIQGTAADIMKVAMVRVWQRLGTEHLRARLLLQVHDELLLEVPLDEVDTVKLLLEEEMSQAAQLIVPLRVSVGVGRNWEEAH